MVREDAVKIARQYVASLSEHGLKISRAILFGSFARGDFNDESDIDLLLVSPDFDTDNDRYYGLLWKLTKISDNRSFRYNFAAFSVKITFRQAQCGAQ